MKVVLLILFAYYIIYRFGIFLLDTWQVKAEAKQIRQANQRRPKPVINHQL